MWCGQNVDLIACLMFASDIFGLFNEASFKNDFYRLVTVSAKKVPLTLYFFESEADEPEAYILPQRLTFYLFL